MSFFLTDTSFWFFRDKHFLINKLLPLLYTLWKVLLKNFKSPNVRDVMRLKKQ